MGGREGEKYQYVRETAIGCLSHTPNRGLVRNPGMCPDRESNRQHFALWDEAQPRHTSQGYLVFFKKQTQISHRLCQDKESPTSGLSEVGFIVFFNISYSSRSVQNPILTHNQAALPTLIPQESWTPCHQR